MDKMNQQFQELLVRKNFKLKMYEEEEAWIYQGKLELNRLHFVDFSVSLSKGEDYSIAQITYRNIAYVKDDRTKSNWYRLLNKLNKNNGIFYYFCLDEQDALFARYVSEVSKDLEYFFHILVQGPALIKQVLPVLEEQFGKFVVLK
ncbi:TPA: hypothetical protein U0919_002162 [Streptococcus suis]|nr:hypothetical protein [Streptococcus suis]